MKVPHAVLEEIRAANDVATVIGAYFTLQRSGGTFKALCPFHKEKTPSFHVNVQRQIYHCFGCGAGGDVFRFVMDYEKVDFLTAVKMLAQRANIPIQWEGAGPEEDRPGKQALYELNAAVARLYRQTLLTSPAGEPGRRYLSSRALPAEALERFQVGFAPAGWDTVLRWAGTQYRRDQLEAAGLIVPARQNADGTGRWYDRFRNRLMFPIQDEQGRVLGFSGRVLESEPDAAKYVNTPETLLFRKGRVLYALHQARRAIVESREALVCEGQIDVIRCHAAGFGNAVAAQGTAFTEDHARILKRYADGVVLVFDADRAGQDAALRAAEQFLGVGLAVRIAALPAGQDPDSLIRGPNGAAAFRDLLGRAVSALDFHLTVLASRERVDTEAGLMRIAAAVAGTIVRTPNPVQQARLVQQAAARLAIPESALQAQVNALRPRSRPAAAPAAAKPPPAACPSRETALAEHLVADVALADLVAAYLPPDLITDPTCRAVVRACLQARAGRRDLTAVVSEQDDEQRTLASFLARLAAAPAKIKSEFATAEESVQSLILSIRTADLQRRRLAIERRRRAGRLSSDARLSAAEDKALEMDYIQIGYDIARLKSWDTAVPVLETLTPPPGDPA